jgi:1,4-alpha-glucan branching enzyme
VPTDGGFPIDYDTLSHAPLGATLLSTGGTVFRVWAPTATSAYVRGQFNGWGLGNPMTRLGDEFIARVPAATDRQRYKFFFQPGDIWKPDARARALDPSDNYNSIIEDPFRYAWSDDPFETPPFDEMVLYELHVGTFSGRNDPDASGSIPGTYLDVAAHADHLAELGINVVNLMPINEFPADFSAGYNPVSAWAPEWIYGDPDDLKMMIDALHHRGIAVLQDIVWNHFSPTDNYLWYYDGGQIYFDDPAVDTPWGSQADFDRADVRDYFADSSLYWLNEFHFDGYRMDATDFMNAYQGSGWGLMQRFNDQIDNRLINALTDAEQLPDDEWVTRPTNLGGAGFDSQWHDSFTDDLRQAIFDAAFGDPEMWRIRDIINGGGTYLSRSRVTNYLELHDELWPESGGQRMVKSIDTTFPHDDKYAKGRTKLGQGIVLLAPGIPIIHQGTEWLEDTDFGGGDAGGGRRIDWSKKQQYAHIFDYYQHLIGLRRANCVLRSSAAHDVFHLNDSGNVIAWQRYDNDGNLIVVIANFSNTNFTNYLIDMPAGGTWYELLNSQALDYDGNGMGNGGSFFADLSAPHTAAITIPEMGLLVVRLDNPPGRGSDLDIDGDTDVADFARLQDQIGHSGCGQDGDLNEDGRVNALDFEIFVAELAGP